MGRSQAVNSHGRFGLASIATSRPIDASGLKNPDTLQCLFQHRPSAACVRHGDIRLLLILNVEPAREIRPPTKDEGILTFPPPYCALRRRSADARNHSACEASSVLLQVHRPCAQRQHAAFARTVTAQLTQGLGRPFLFSPIRVAASITLAVVLATPAVLLLGQIQRLKRLSSPVIYLLYPVRRWC